MKLDHRLCLSWATSIQVSQLVGVWGAERQAWLSLLFKAVPICILLGIGSQTHQAGGFWKETPRPHRAQLDRGGAWAAMSAFSVRLLPLTLQKKKKLRQETEEVVGRNSPSPTGPVDSLPQRYKPGLETRSAASHVSWSSEQLIRVAEGSLQPDLPTPLQ